jgi:hypothetical protein
MNRKNIILALGLIVFGFVVAFIYWLSVYFKLL